jgi:hypothetical protein
MVAHLDRISRRSFGALTVGAAVAATTFRAAAAQDASPMASPAAEEAGILESLDLTALNITATEYTFNISNPGALAEGWYVINLINESETNATANLALLPEGTSAGDLSALASQAFKGEGGELPAWWSETQFAGGTFAAPGETSSAVVYLTTGQWSVFATNPTSIQSPANFRVLTPEELEANYGVVTEAEATPVVTPGATPDVIPAPQGVEASMTLSVADDGFTPSGAPASGPQIIEIMNDGEQVHDVVILHTEEELDEASAGSLAQSYVRGEEIDATLEGGVGTLSAGARAYVELSGDAGTHLVFSSLPDANGGIQLETVGVLVFTA